MAALQPVPGAPTPRQRLRLTACLALIALPHAFHLPLWISALAAVLLTWQAVTAWRQRPLPGRVFRFALAAGAFGVVLAGFGRINGQEAGVSLLLLMLVLKLCEMHSHRDAMVFVSLTCFLLVTQFLFSQSLAMAAVLVVGTWLVTLTFIDVSAGIGTRPAARDSARLLVHALPVAALLFVLFPRIPGPIWGLPADAGASARSGLSDQMSPGSIANVALSQGVALRAQFSGPVPPAQARYWRGPVLWDFDRGTWRRGDAAQQLPSAEIDVDGSRIRQVDITLEPTRHDWLIALDMPLATDHRSRQTAGATLIADDDIDQKTRYTTRSATDYTLDPRLPSATRQRATALPIGGNPRARALAQQWRNGDTSSAAIMDKALAMFREQPFAYTLSPPRTGRETSIDDFLFETREGFCEHYAGAFTFVMRAAGIPARVVTGYQGGERALMGDYWVVRNADAHAWTEVWLAGRGWVRVDPTAAVAPDRVESGVAASLSNNAALPYMSRASGNTWYRVQMLWDGINATWDRWFLAYGPQLQQRVLGVLGLAGWTRALLALTAGVVVLLALISLWLGWQARRVPHPDPVVRAWQRVCARLAAIGYPREPHEGPQAYGARIARARPDLATDMRLLVDLYIRQRYAPRPDAETEQTFIARAAAFRPARTRQQE